MGGRPDGDVVVVVAGLSTEYVLEVVQCIEMML